MLRVFFSCIPVLFFAGFAIRAAHGGRIENAVVFMVLCALTLIFPICFFAVALFKRRMRRLEG
ncbi:MAG: hypothetical protein RL326_380 [Pseudomonadota bacterium]|jgi:hypothetical protein